ncbi:TrmH family RNA methyltransferase [Pseudofrankia inefficax]|uniref:tRNA/rRNA methyltransferase (SpoU) n=1 Tax=Pseudofrankia inefficax (strain DSM 45817 / CECT 9037 / DDB 130130 / EuI1c) TaxID=298654 RepID=E3IYB2_PSEI1|nr:RNA methyltransferase [Pseudofrankia inefficax]ADP83857.1 tRNA/rRNA methyltransferase (SpoU) [Pseudofrankia inefficax]
MTASMPPDPLPASIALTIIPVDDPADPRVADYVALTDVVLRRRKEPAEGLFIAEGERVIQRALRAGYRARSVLVSPNRLDAVPAELGPEVPVYLAGPELMAKITGFEVHRGALAAMARHPARDPAELLSWALRVLVLEDLVSHTNLGAVFRSAAGLGMDAILLSPRCADPLYRRSVRVSMGEVFAVPYARLDPWPAALDTLADRGFETLALTPAADAADLATLRPVADARLAVLLGTEGEGLSAAAQAAATRRVRIPMAAGVDSLNVAATAAIACYALGRR